MSSEIYLDIGVISVTPKKDGSDDRVEFIEITDFGLYERTKGKKTSYEGGSEKFMNYAGCDDCPVKDSLCEPATVRENNIIYIGRKVSYNSEVYSDDFPCYRRYEELDKE